MEHHRITTSNVSRETFEATKDLYASHKDLLEEYIDQLFWWNDRINLVSRDVSRETIENHLHHSLLISQLSPFISEKNIIDAGTGGGLPGIPLAITHPGKSFILNDIVTKKCLAVKQMVRHLGLDNITIVDRTVANLQYDTPFLLISKHAFKVNDLYSMTSHLPWTAMVLYKGLEFQGELAGIEPPLSIERYDLTEGSDFYKGKALVIIRR
ncbi:16S rRNA (guanine(527)-N(7))-methyltransferase RsmG [Fodinibius sediminis]|uniref:Ribosomal RNA small subunit methyltransferase G n=1 Tax=Fodinibius sediminis TaxID=1214077 RepID=A0A521BEE8_9BACT|nr:RsmG family class I SAM-dependent methyltransferase [Fodinibius sediminis]SMO45487.1 16S rRNA m(7)G-527 methyltransferase [Fodinibius sediminis]